MKRLIAIVKVLITIVFGVSCAAALLVLVLELLPRFRQPPMVGLPMFLDFLGSWHNISVDLGEASFGIPSDRSLQGTRTMAPEVTVWQGSVVRATSAELPTRSLLSSNFYLFIKEPQSDGWTVVRRTIGSYEPTKLTLVIIPPYRIVWLARLSKGLFWMPWVGLVPHHQKLHVDVLVGAEDHSGPDRFKDGQKIDVLPVDLKYTKLHVIQIRE